MTENQAKAPLNDLLDRLGVAAGDCLMLGVDMGALPLPKYPADLSREALQARAEKWCRFVVDTLTHRLTPTGTLLVPAYSYACTKPGAVFDPMNTPSEIGPFPEYFRRHCAVTRSIHPIFSVSGAGKHAGAILDNVGRAAFGSLSPFGRFTEHGVRFLGLGVEIRRALTYLHHLEQNFGCPHRFHKTFYVDVERGGKKTRTAFFAYLAYRGLGYEADFREIQSELQKRGKLIEAAWQGRPSHLVDIAAVNEVGLAMLAENPMAFTDRKLGLRFSDTSGGTEPVCRVTVTSESSSPTLSS